MNLMIMKKLNRNAMEHFRFLEALYKKGRINQQHFSDTDIQVTDGRATISVTIDAQWHHAKDSMHGCIYFKFLDDAAYFATASQIEDQFIVTKSFQVDLLRPHDTGKLIAEGTLESMGEKEFIASAILKNEKGKIIGKGQGVFVKSRIALKEEN